MHTITGNPPHLLVKITVPTDHGPLNVIGGEAPYHLSVFAELYINRVSFEISTHMMVWPDRDIDCVPEDQGAPSPHQCLVIQRVGGGAGPSEKARQQALETICGALEDLPADYLRACNAAWVENRTHPIYQRVTMLKGIIANLEHDIALYQSEEGWYA